MSHNPRFSILQGRAVKDKRLSDAQLRTLAALGTYTDEEGWCFPRLQVIGDDLGKSKQAVGRDVLALKKLGYLEITPRFNSDGGRRSSMYRLLFDPPRQPDVDTPSTLGVDTPSTSEVDVKDPINDPKNKSGLSEKDIADANREVDAILGQSRDAAFREEGPKMFEAAFRFGKLPWDTSSDWTAFSRFVQEAYAKDQMAFGRYVIWRAGEGKYSAMSNKQIRQQPRVFMDCWPEFESVGLREERPEYKPLPPDPKEGQYVPAPPRRKV